MTQSTAAVLAKFNPRHGAAAAIAPAERRVIKRDGATVPWDVEKIIRAIGLALHEVKRGPVASPQRDDPGARYGLDREIYLQAQRIAARVGLMLELYYRTGRHPTIEQIQDNVEKAIAAEGEWEVARSYIVYREHKASHRLNSLSRKTA